MSFIGFLSPTRPGHRAQPLRQPSYQKLRAGHEPAGKSPHRPVLHMPESAVSVGAGTTSARPRNDTDSTTCCFHVDTRIDRAKEVNCVTVDAERHVPPPRQGSNYRIRTSRLEYFIRLRAIIKRSRNDRDGRLAWDKEGAICLHVWK